MGLRLPPSGTRMTQKKRCYGCLSLLEALPVGMGSQRSRRVGFFTTDHGAISRDSWRLANPGRGFEVVPGADHHLLCIARVRDSQLTQHQPVGGLLALVSTKNSIDDSGTLR